MVADNVLAYVPPAVADVVIGRKYRGSLKRKEPLRADQIEVPANPAPPAESAPAPAEEPPEN